jgi:hypothetical protein
LTKIDIANDWLFLCDFSEEFHRLTAIKQTVFLDVGLFDFGSKILGPLEFMHDWLQIWPYPDLLVDMLNH